MTETGRWASSETPWKTGQNGQNVTKPLRRLLVADAGWLMFQMDKEQAESRAVAVKAKAICGDDSYEKACQTEDIHVSVAQDIYGVKDAEEAKRSVVGDFSYRDMCKRVGHLTNYYGTPRSIAMQLHIPEKQCAEFQGRYFERFPGIKNWHNWVITKLQATGEITTATGRRRQFWGRTDDLSVIREAIAFEPQSLVADDINYGILRVWRELVPTGDVKIHLQVHDALVGQVRLECATTYLPRIVECLTNRVKVPVATELQSALGPYIPLTIPVATEIGFNWGPAKETNLRGLRTVTPETMDAAIDALISPNRSQALVPAA